MVLWKTALRAHAENVARRIGFRAYGCYTWIVFAVFLLAFGGLAILTGRVDRTRRLARFIARSIFRLSGVPLSITGLERLPSCPHVLVSNHASFLDGIVLIALLPASPGYAFIVRQQYALQSLLWPFLRSLRTLVLRPYASHHYTENVNILKSALERGENLIVFPEGGFVAGPGLQPFHSGTFTAAAQAHVPVVVAGLRGTRQALRIGTWMPKRLPLSVEIGPMLMPDGADADAVHAFMRNAHAAMIPLTGEPAPASPA